MKHNFNRTTRELPEGTVYEYYDISRPERVWETIGFLLYKTRNPVLISIEGGETRRFEASDIEQMTPKQIAAYAAQRLADQLKPS